MLFDDRLATVLRNSAPSEAAARTQYRQLLDLLGSMPPDAADELVERAYERLDGLAEALPAAVQSAILRGPGLRLRNRALVARLAAGEPQAAAAAMAMAQLSERDWLHLIPRLPMTARGFLRHRRDLPFSAKQVLERLGVKDLVLPEPERRSEQAPAPSEPVAEAPLPADADAGIGALVRRIEAFQRARREASVAPRLPLGDVRDTPAEGRQAFDFATDAQGEVTWADPAMAPLAVGLRLGPERPGGTATLDAPGAAALARRQPLRGASLRIEGPDEIAGAWRIDAAPFFWPESGQFAGYRGRLRRRRAAAPRAQSAATTGTSDRMRQLLHELRTPVGAIQGFAELIQQQMFGPAPNEYRALAAAVAVDAARLLAGFDEIDRLARLESGALRLDEGQSDFRAAVAGIQRRLDGVLRPRSARIDLAVRGGPFVVAMDETDALQLAWRVLATLAGALAPGEVIDVVLTGDGAGMTIEADLPASLAAETDLFAATAPAQPRAISAGMFGSGFTLRLARAEAAAAGGSLAQHEDRLQLTLPVLTATGTPHTVRSRESGGASAA